MEKSKNWPRIFADSRASSAQSALIRVRVFSSSASPASSASFLWVGRRSSDENGRISHIPGWAGSVRAAR